MQEIENPHPDAIIRSMHEPSSLRLGVNIDHVATLRNARGGTHPDPVRAALLDVEAAAETGAQVVELHTGRYCEEAGKRAGKELEHIKNAAADAVKLGLECHAGHGLSFDTVKPVAAMPEMMELNIGHSLIGEAVFEGLTQSILRMKQLMREART